MVVYSLLRESDREFGIRTTISPTPTVVGEGFLSQKRRALCKATGGNGSIVRIKLSNTIQLDAGT